MEVDVMLSHSPRNGEWEAVMSPNLDVAGFCSLSTNGRVAHCRTMAAEAERFASSASGDLRACYLELASQWSELAREIATIGRRYS
jgi:hypothetical protein